MNFDETPIYCHTDYSYEQLKEFQKAHYKKSRTFSLVFLCLTVLLLVVHLFSKERDFFFGFMLFLATLIFLFSFLTSIGATYTHKKHEKASVLRKNGADYEFRNHDFSVRSQQEVLVSNTKMKYEGLHSVVEGKTAFYLYISPIQSYVVDKSSLRCQQPIQCVDALRYLLVSSLPPKKYKRL